MRDRLLLGLALCALLAGSGAGCRGRSADARRESDLVTAEAEAMAKAQELTTTSAELETGSPAVVAAPGAREMGAAETEMSAAFRLEQADFRGRLQVALDQLDHAVRRATHDAGARELRARRALLKSDLEAVNRSTEQDWATLRTKLERDLEAP